MASAANSADSANPGRKLRVSGARTADNNWSRAVRTDSSLPAPASSNGFDRSGIWPAWAFSNSSRRREHDRHLLEHGDVSLEDRRSRGRRRLVPSRLDGARDQRRDRRQADDQTEVTRGDRERRAAAEVGLLNGRAGQRRDRGPRSRRRTGRAPGSPRRRSKRAGMPTRATRRPSSSEPPAPPCTSDSEHATGRTATPASGRALTTSAPSIGENCQTVTTRRTERKSAPTIAPNRRRSRFGREEAAAVEAGARQVRSGGGIPRRAREPPPVPAREDRPPVEQLGEDSPQRGSDGYADRPGPGPDGGASMHPAGQRAQNGKRTGEEERCAGPLNAAKGEQRRQAPGQPAADRGAEEQRETSGRLEPREAPRRPGSAPARRSQPRGCRP